MSSIEKLVQIHPQPVEFLRGSKFHVPSLEELRSIGCLPPIYWTAYSLQVEEIIRGYSRQYPLVGVRGVCSSIADVITNEDTTILNAEGILEHRNEKAFNVSRTSTLFPEIDERILFAMLRDTLRMHEQVPEHAQYIVPTLIFYAPDQLRTTA